MVAIENMSKLIANLLNKLTPAQIFATRVLLFGSYAKGKSNHYSDIDLAIWAKGFEGSKAIDYPKIGAVM